jgi:hypothetical protein
MKTHADAAENIAALEAKHKSAEANRVDVAADGKKSSGVVCAQLAEHQRFLLTDA